MAQPAHTESNYFGTECEDPAIGEMKLKEELEKYLEVVYDVKFP
jgi:hypothetical protein